MLDVDNQLWDENMIGQLTQIRGYHAVVSMENIGTYLIGGYSSNMKRTTDFLAQGTIEWTNGPAIPVDMNYPCAVRISNLTFLIIHGTDIREYQVDITDPTSNSGWQSSSKWPLLQTSRTGNPGCSKIQNYIAIAGGYNSDQSEYLRSTELLNLSTRTIVYAGDLNSPRAYFHMATLTNNEQQLILAFGGRRSAGPGASWANSENSVEQFFPSNNTWSLMSTTMEEARGYFGAVTVQRKTLCVI